MLFITINFWHLMSTTYQWCKGFISCSWSQGQVRSATWWTHISYSHEISNKFGGFQMALNYMKWIWNVWGSLDTDGVCSWWIQGWTSWIFMEKYFPFQESVSLLCNVAGQSRVHASGNQTVSYWYRFSLVVNCDSTPVSLSGGELYMCPCQVIHVIDV